MEFETKIKVAVLEDLETWQKMNVVAFLMSGVGAATDIAGQPYRDADGREYLPMSGLPVMVHTAPDAASLRDILAKTEGKEVVTALYTRDLFTTYNDIDNRAAVARVKTADLDLVGLAIYGKKNHVDKLFKGLPLHK